MSTEDNTHPEKKETDTQVRSSWTLEDILKSVTAVIAVLGFAYGVFQFFAQHERQYRQKIYETQLELYKDVIKLSSSISTTPYDSVQTKFAITNSRKFDEFYYGRMTLFEDTSVEQAMIDFKHVKDNYMKLNPDVATRDLQASCLALG